MARAQYHSQVAAYQHLSQSGVAWSSGTVPYEVDNSSFYDCPDLIRVIDLAVRNINQKTAVKFVKRDASVHYDYVIIKCHSQTSRSSIGRQGGGQVLYLHRRYTVGAILHEFMHVLGFIHDNRNRYVCLNREQNGYHDLHSDWSPSSYVILGVYDQDSVMHFGCSGNMMAYSQLNDSPRPGWQRESISPSDIRAIRYMYGPPCCSYDCWGDEYFQQAYYECVTCWGNSSSYGVCRQCAQAHHAGHELIFHSLNENLAEGGEGFVCDCGRYRHRLQLCTSVSTLKRPIQQMQYVCLDCFNIAFYQRTHQGAIPGICINCARKCHAGHDVRFDSYSAGFACDCGTQFCQMPCQAKQ